MFALLTTMLLAVTALLRTCPDTPFSRLVRKVLVEQPLAWWIGFSRRDLIYMVLVCGLLFMGGEIVVMLGPDLLLTYALELSFYFDAVIATAIATQISRIKGGLRAASAMLRRPFQRRGSQQRRKRSPIRKAEGQASANDDEPGPLRLAA